MHFEEIKSLFGITCRAFVCIRLQEFKNADFDDLVTEFPGFWVFFLETNFAKRAFNSKPSRQDTRPRIFDQPLKLNGRGRALHISKIIAGFDLRALFF